MPADRSVIEIIGSGAVRDMVAKAQ